MAGQAQRKAQGCAWQRGHKGHASSQVRQLPALLKQQALQLLRELPGVRLVRLAQPHAHPALCAQH